MAIDRSNHCIHCGQIATEFVPIEVGKLCFKCAELHYKVAKEMRLILFEMKNGLSEREISEWTGDQIFQRILKGTPFEDI